jgi:hypothetical protein
MTNVCLLLTVLSIATSAPGAAGSSAANVAATGPAATNVAAMRSPATRPLGSTEKAPATQRGVIVAAEGRPAHFPHRIWAATDYEARSADFGWFGDAETRNIPAYPGNRTARKGTGPVEGVAALKTGMNPVPGPRMGKVNKIYVRYYLEGTDTVIFQYFSLTSSDNCNIRATGLRQGVWAESVLDFTHDSRRNDGSPGAFQDGERMDDLQVYAGTPGDGRKYTLIIDDPILFAEDPALPPEPEPFPRRVMFLAAFDTAIDARSLPKYYPGQLEIVTDKAPPGSYWGVAKAVPAADGSVSHVVLQMKPPRPSGPNTKIRFRYWIKGADMLAVRVHDATADRQVGPAMIGCPQGQWRTQYFSLSRSERTDKGEPMPAGSLLDVVSFDCPLGGELYIDEVVLFDSQQEATTDKH